MLNAKELLSEARAFLNDRAATIWPDGGQLLSFINSYQRRLYHKARETAENVFWHKTKLTYSDFTDQSNGNGKRWKTTLPPYIRNIIMMERVDGARVTTPEWILPRNSPIRSSPYVFDPDRDFQIESSITRELRGSELWLFGTITDGFEAELAWSMPPPDLFYGKIKGVPTTTSLEVDTAAITGSYRRMDNYYLGGALEITTSAVTSILSQPRDIASSAGTTLTLASALPAAPANGDEIALLSPIPMEFHGLLAKGGALLALQAKGVMRAASMLAREVVSEEQEFIRNLETREQDAPRFVTEVEASEDYTF